MPPKVSEVRIYVDEDLLGLGKLLASIRPDITYPGDPGAVIRKRERPACPIATGAKDTIWLPQVTSFGWLIVSRDHNIRETPAELAAVRDNGSRMVALSGVDAVSKWDQLELFMRRWRQIEALLSEPGPFIYLAQRSRFATLDLG